MQHGCIWKECLPPRTACDDAAESYLGVLAVAQCLLSVQQGWGEADENGSSCGEQHSCYQDWQQHGQNKTGVRAALGFSNLGIRRRGDALRCQQRPQLCL